MTSMSNVKLPNSGTWQLGPQAPTYNGQAVSSINGSLVVKGFNYPIVYETMITDEVNGHCDSCKKDDKILAYEYGNSSIKRRICEFCYITWMDKKFGIQSDSNTLETLFKKD